MSNQKHINVQTANDRELPVKLREPQSYRDGSKSWIVEVRTHWSSPNKAILVAQSLEAAKEWIQSEVRLKDGAPKPVQWDAPFSGSAKGLDLTRRIRLED